MTRRIRGRNRARGKGFEGYDDAVESENDRSVAAEGSRVHAPPTMRLFGPFQEAVASRIGTRLASSSGAILLRTSGNKSDVYNVLWVLVFGFATLNILALVARSLEPSRRGLRFGELLAILVVVVSVGMLAWEMLNLFHIFPIRLSPR
jgi:hypothetical protein